MPIRSTGIYLLASLACAAGGAVLATGPALASAPRDCSFYKRTSPRIVHGAVAPALGLTIGALLEPASPGLVLPPENDPEQDLRQAIRYARAIDVESARLVAGPLGTGLAAYAVPLVAKRPHPLPAACTRGAGRRARRYVRLEYRALERTYRLPQIALLSYQHGRSIVATGGFPAAEVARRGITQVLQSGADTAALGVVPDGVARVTLVLRSSRTLTVATPANGFVATYRGTRLPPREVIWFDADGRKVRDVRLHATPVLGSL